MPEADSTIIIVTFIYKLDPKFSIDSEFQEILEKLGWSFSLQNKLLPDSTCVKILEAVVTPKEAIEYCVNEIKLVIQQLRESGAKNFNVDKYYFISHTVPGSIGHFGHNLLEETK